MERNKYREQIQNTSILPTSDSWERLSEKLELHENEQKINKWVFIKYAASFIILLSVSFYFFRSENEINVPPTSKEQQIKSSGFEVETKTLIAAPLEISPIIISKRNKPEADDLTAHEVKKTIVQNTKIDEEEVISNTEMDKDFTKEKHENADRLSAINEVTDTEIELLLKNASLNIEKNSQYLDKTKITAIDLLGEIEDDLEKDTRRKLFEKIIITIKNPTEIEITDRSK